MAGIRKKMRIIRAYLEFMVLPPLYACVCMCAGYWLYRKWQKELFTLKLYRLTSNVHLEKWNSALLSMANSQIHSSTMPPESVSKENHNKLNIQTQK